MSFRVNAVFRFEHPYSVLRHYCHDHYYHYHYDDDDGYYYYYYYYDHHYCYYHYDHSLMAQPLPSRYPYH